LLVREYGLCIPDHEDLIVPFSHLWRSIRGHHFDDYFFCRVFLYLTLLM